MNVYYFTIYLRFNDSKKKMALHHTEIADTKAKARMCAQLFAQDLAREFDAKIINIRYDDMDTV